MTTSIASEVSDRKKAKRPPNERLTFAGEMREQILLERTLSTRVRFPSDLYRAKPVEFFRLVLGVKPWKRQIEMIEAVRDYPRVAICSGHKISKSHTAAGIALWYYCSFPDARVVMTSTTSRQVDQILWRELRMMRYRGGRCVDCQEKDPDGYLIPRPCEHSTLIEGDLGELARTGFKSYDFREIVGFTAKEAEAVAGISGKNLLYIVDEASGVGDDIFEAIEGNRAGGARIVMFGNGTRNSGEFFDAFNSKSELYKTLRVSSEETPNVVEQRVVIPGLAEYEWVEEKKREWGENSSLYRVRVKGEHAIAEEGKIFSLHRISEAEARWAETPEAGRLFVGVDPAGDSGLGDRTAFSVRRGLKQLELVSERGLTAEAHLVRLIGIVATHKLPRELAVVVVDREGLIGSQIYGLLKNYVEMNPSAFELVGVRASDKAVRQGEIYDRMRDLLCGNFNSWLLDGGAIVENARLEKQLHALEWKYATNGKQKLLPKEQLRKLLGGSPDEYDATVLSCWEPLSLRLNESESSGGDSGDDDDEDSERVMDPYAGSDAWHT